MLCAGACNNHSRPTQSGYDTPDYIPEYATGFKITSADGKQSSLITVTNPWQGADSVTSQLFIARNGESVPDGYTGQIINGNASRIVTMSSTHIAMLDALGADSLIVGVSGINYITNPYIQANRNRIADVGYDTNINYELLMSLQPDIVLLYGVNGANSVERKLTETGIPFMYIGDYVEDSPLGKAEWLVAIAELTGQRSTGENLFAKICESYLGLRQTVADSVSDTPSVMLNTPYRDSWFMPSTNSYFAQLISDAGGDYIYKKNTGNTSQPIDLEEAYRLTSEADVWLNSGSANSLDELRAECPKFTDTRCFRNGCVYNNTRRATPGGGNDFFESAIVHPDLLLRDLVKIFHPELLPEHELYYYKQLK